LRWENKEAELNSQRQKNTAQIDDLKSELSFAKAHTQKLEEHMNTLTQKFTELNQKVTLLFCNTRSVFVCDCEALRSSLCFALLPSTALRREEAVQ
jgi:hypothetical protein